MTGDLPEIIRRYQDAHDAHDVEGTVATFAPTATVLDDGKQWSGTAEIRAWLIKTSTEYTYTRTMLGAELAVDGSWLVRHRLEGNFPGSVVDLGYRFELAGAHISRLTIAP